MFIPSVFKSIQSGGFNFGSGNTDHTLGTTLANINNAAIIFNGCASSDNGGFPDGNGSAFLYLVNTTTIRASAYLAFGTVTYTVIEFYPGFLRSATQFSSVTMNGVTSAGQAITAVGSKAFVLYTGLTQNTNSSQADMASVTAILTLTSNILVTANRYGAGGASAPDICTVGFCVVDPK